MSTDNQSRDELQNQLLELVYGLLDDDEAAALRERIAGDPEVAAAHAEAQRFADSLAASARLIEPQVQMSTKTRSPWRHRIEIRADRNGEPAASAPVLADPSRAVDRVASDAANSSVEQRISRAMRRTAAIAAAILAIVAIGGYLATSWPLFGLDGKHIRLTVSGPHQLEPGIENLFAVSTSSAIGRPIAAPISFTLRAADGNAMIAKTTATTDGDGRLTIKLKPTMTDAERFQDARFEIVLADRGNAVPLAELVRIDSAGLATQLSLDKPLYQPGEIVRYRSLTLTRFGLTPPAGAIVYFEIHDPSGAVVPNSWQSVVADRGIAGGEFSIPPSLPGGEYTLIARSPAKQFADEKRSFIIRSYRLPRLKKDLEFTRDSYSPGDHVVADLSVQRSDGGPAAGAKLHAIASVDGKPVAQSDDVIGPAGTARVEINLPVKVEKGDAQLAVVIDDGGNRETVAKSIRINLDRVEVSLYPEGGDLVAGLENRVYFSARTPLGKPAHIVGQLVDSRFRELARLETSYKGMGSFTFTPQAGESYSVTTGKLKVSLVPEELKADPMPSVLLSTGPGVFGAKEPLQIELQSREDKLPLLIAAYCRGVLIGEQALTAKQGVNRVEIPLAAGAGGVVRVTVFEQPSERGRQPRAIAERLVYRRPERSLNVRVGDHKPRYSPGDPVELSLAITNERGEPTPAALGVSVAADSLYKLIDDELPSMPTRFYLLGEIDKPEDLEKADFYLSDDSKAPAALDLLLGTQGWRRFADKRMSDYVFKDDGSDPFNRLAAVGSPSGPPMTLDNADEASRAYQADLDRHTSARDVKLNSLGHALLLAAAPIGLLFIFMLAWGSIGRLQFWLPTFGAAACSLIAAAIWSNLPARVTSEADSGSIAKSSSAAAEAIINQTANTSQSLFGDQRLGSSLRNYFRGNSSVMVGAPNGERYGCYFCRPTSGIFFEGSDFREKLEPTNAPLAMERNAGVESSLNGVFVVSESPMTDGGGSMSSNGAVALNSGSLSLANASSSTLTLAGNSTVSNDMSAGAFAVANTGVGDGWEIPVAQQSAEAESKPGMTLNNSMALSGNNTYAGSTQLNGGTLNLNGANTFTGGLTMQWRTRPVFDDRSASATLTVAGTGSLSLGNSTLGGMEEYAPQPTVSPYLNLYSQGAGQNNGKQSSRGLVAHVYVDGHAPYTADSVDASTYLALMTRSEEEPIDDTKIDGGWTYRKSDGSLLAGSNQQNDGYKPIDVTKIAGGGIIQRAVGGTAIGLDGTAYTVSQVREYAHHYESSPSGARADFAETLYWNPLLITGSDGKATIKFDLCDAVAKFRVLVDAHVCDPAAGEGRIGSGSGEVVAAMPLSVEPKLPLEVNAGDRIDLPVAVVNDTEAPLSVSLTVDVPAAGDSHEIISPTVPTLIEADGANSQEVKLPAGGRSRAYFPLHVTGAAGSAQIEIRGQTGGKLADAKRQSLTVVSAGYPIAASYGGNLNGDVALTVRVPKDYMPGSLAVRLTAYPSPTSQIEDGLEGILREPTGCFEQTSTSNYPNVLALEYLQERKLANPELTRRCKAFLQTGYSRLTSYESKSGGFEWFGGDPGHETLTGYGLMEFHEMARVFPVDQALIDRTAKWLLSRRDGKGGFQRGSNGHYFGFGTNELNDAYITWALTEAGVTGIDAEIKHAIEIGKRSEDPYIIALAAITALNVHDDHSGLELLDWLVKLQAADGHLEGRESFAYSGGVSLEIETTALAAQAWLKVPAYWGQAEKAIDWIAAHRQSGGGFGSTQGTILALKALVEHARISKKNVTGGELIIKREGQTIAKQTFAAGQQEAIRIDSLAAKLEPGENHLTIALSGENRMPYSLDVGYRSHTGSSDPSCAVRLITKLASATVKAGETVSLEAELSNATDKPQPMTVAILGLPAGLEPRAKQLDDLKKSFAIDYYETRPREIICYWRKLDAGQKKPLRLDLVAEVPGQYMAPGSRAYLYYTAERKQWCEPLKVTITRE